MQKLLKSISLLVLVSFVLAACQVSSTSKVSVNVNGENVIDAKSGFDTEDPNLFSVVAMNGGGFNGPFQTVDFYDALKKW